MATVATKIEIVSDQEIIIDQKVLDQGLTPDWCIKWSEVEKVLLRKSVNEILTKFKIAEEITNDRLEIIKQTKTGSLTEVEAEAQREKIFSDVDWQLRHTELHNIPHVNKFKIPD